MLENRLTRYAITAAILLVIGGLFVQREFSSDDADTELGVLENLPVAEGKPAPDFVLRDVNDNLVRLSDFRGKTVVLNFWATWCAPCRAEMPDLQAIYEQRLPDNDFVVLAVDLEESRGPVEDFIDEFGLTFPVAFDSSGSVARHYGVIGLPDSFFIDSEGIVREVILGPVFGSLLGEGIESADSAVDAAEDGGTSTAVIASLGGVVALVAAVVAVVVVRRRGGRSDSVPTDA